MWLALALSVLGSTLLVFPQPFLALAQATPEVADKVRGYLLALAFALPAALLFTAYRGFNTAVSRPKAVMVLQLGGLALKVPLSAALVFGVPALGVPALGRHRLRHRHRDRHVGAGAGRAGGAAARPVLRAASRCAATAWRRRTAPSLRRCCAWACRWALSILIEVTGFAFMAFFISRLGATPVAGHQIAANLVSLMFMMPLALANATSTLVAQRIGAGDAARRAAPGLARPADRRWRWPR